MRICIIHQYYKTPETGGAIRSYYIARYLTRLGHDVCVITARNNKEYSIDNIEGVEVHYLPVYYENHLSFLSRIHAFFLFVWKAKRLMKKLIPIDLNYVITTPLTTGLIALYGKNKLRIPYIFEIGDLWPEAPIQLGVLKNPLLKTLARKWEKSFYENAESLIALSTDIKNYIHSQVPEQRVEVITNFADTTFFNLEEKQSSLEAQFKVKGKFVISYLGTVGLANELEYLLSVVKAVKAASIHFIIAGGGAKFNSIRKQAKEMDNITFFEHMNKKELKEIVNVTDAIYVSFKDVEILSSGSPNKFFDGLAAGKLIITNFGGWIRDLIENNNCGFYHSPHDPDSFLEKISPFIHDEKQLKQAQKNAYSLASKFSPELQLDKLKDLIQNFNKAYPFN